MKLFGDFFWSEDTQWAKEVPERWAVEATTHQGALGPPRRALMGCALHVPPSTTFDAYKYPNIQKTLGESMKNTSNHRKFQNLEIQSNTITEGFIFFIGASPMMRE